MNINLTELRSMTYSEYVYRQNWTLQDHLNCNSKMVQDFINTYGSNRLKAMCKHYLNYSIREGSGIFENLISDIEILLCEID